MPGVVAIVVDPDNVLFEAAAGQQDVARQIEMKPDAIVRIYSMTKPITTVAAMMLNEEGKFQLDDPVSKYLPRFKDRPVIASFNPSTGAYETKPAVSRSRDPSSADAHVRHRLRLVLSNRVSARRRRPKQGNRASTAARARREVDLRREHESRRAGRRDDFRPAAGRVRARPHSRTAWDAGHWVRRSARQRRPRRHRSLPIGQPGWSSSQTPPCKSRL